MSQNYYEILGVNQNSSNKEIRLAYIRLCKQFHPDLNRNEDNSLLSKTKFQDINKAYNCLIKHEERQAYDQHLRYKQQNDSFAHNYQQNNFYDNYQNSSHYNNTRNRHNFYDNHDNYDDYYERLRKRQFEEMFGRNDERFYNSYNRGFNNYYNNRRDYYGFRGVKRVDNSVIAKICGLIIFCGFLLHWIQYKISVYQINEMRSYWKRNGSTYQQIKQKAKY